jgi:elongation factor 3
MASPGAVPNTIKALSSTTFVAEVNAPTLAVLVPLLGRALKERSTDTQRMTCVVIGNLVKLVRDPNVAARYLGGLVNGVEALATGAAFPEIRAFAQTALDILINAGASASDTPLPPRDINAAVIEALTVMAPHLKMAELPSHPSIPLSASLPNSPVIAHAVENQANIIADLVEMRRWDASIWDTKGLGSFMKLLLGAEQGAAGTEAIRKAFMDIDKAKFVVVDEEDNEEGEILCDIQFSLAYGGLLLLNHTNLKLRRGRRYGICAGNGAGKSTLMKAIRDQKVSTSHMAIADDRLKDSPVRTNSDVSWSSTPFKVKIPRSLSSTLSLPTNDLPTGRSPRLPPCCFPLVSLKRSSRTLLLPSLVVGR